MNKNQALIRISESDQTSVGKQPFAQQSLPQKVFSAIWQLEAEVNNGGFSQYFLNSSCETAPFVVEALETIAAPHTADICRRAIATAFASGLPASADAISEAAADFPDDVLDRLDLLDREFYKYPNNLTDLLFDYVLLHPEEFGELPKN